MNCTQVVETMPAVTTIDDHDRADDAARRPSAASPSSGLTSAPAPTICGIR